ncbi:BAI1-associated protein 3 [Schistosoma japonicum]|nr:BAI1-associated protein 3 [Schistosoma japonicum]
MNIKRATVDNNFFRKLSWEELEKDLSDLNTTTSTEIHDDFQQTKDDLVKIDIEYLFVRVQYTLKNQIGRTSNKFSSSPEAIDRYVKQVFGLTQEVYDVLCAQACQAEPPIVVLNVSVIEAKNLEAKDLNVLKAISALRSFR